MTAPQDQERAENNGVEPEPHLFNGRLSAEGEGATESDTVAITDPMNPDSFDPVVPSAQGDGDPGDPAIEAADMTLLGPDGEPLRRYEAWLREDWRHLVQAMKVAAKRGVVFTPVCLRCQRMLQQDGTEADGTQLIVCACTVRRWRR